MPQKRTRRKSERRARPRADARLSMRLEGTPDAQSAQIVTESQNISSSGVYCTSSHFLAPLSKVALTIVLPRLSGSRAEKELIKCDGIVVRCQPSPKKGEKGYELACMFSGLDEQRRVLLDEFVAWRNLQALRAATRAAGSGRATPRTRTAAAKARPRTKTAARRRTVH
jgi:hypothetical protein